MSRTLLACVAFCLLSLTGNLLGQVSQPPPLPGGSPLVYVRFVGDADTQVGFFAGAATARLCAAPVTVGLRPGYVHRVELINPPGHPGVRLFPTLEVRGTLFLPPQLRASNYPAAIVFTPEEIERALHGVLLTKVIYLEDPEKALPVASTVDRPLELDAGTGLDPVAEAKEHGRPMIVVRLGSRQLDAAEMTKQTLPGLILLPGEPRLDQPPYPPYVAFNCWPLYDPVAGPRMPVEECLKDGGDKGLPAGFDAHGKLYGLDPSDTVAEYRDSLGNKQLAISNRICICVPRFGVIRQETPLSGYESLATLNAHGAVLGQDQLRVKTPSRERDGTEPLLALGSRERPSIYLTRASIGQIIRVEILQARHNYTETMMLFMTETPHQLTEVQRTEMRKQVEVAYKLSRRDTLRSVTGYEGPAVVGRVLDTNLIATLQEARDYTACCEEKPQVPDKPLQLCKWAEPHDPKVGDVVTFHLKYSNVGGKPITDVAVADSLTGRLEYIPGSAVSDRDAVFTLQANEAGSVVVRWEITGVLQPGQVGVVTFQARIR
jgi:uncharacterized repeat protein (TIGR01451 family)